MIEEPRKDLKEDSDIWKTLLNTALVDNQELYNNLRGFRSAGCRLALNHEKRDLSFNFGDATDSEKELIKKYARESTDRIKHLFKRVYMAIERSLHEEKSH